MPPGEATPPPGGEPGGSAPGQPPVTDVDIPAVAPAAAHLGTAQLAATGSKDTALMGGAALAALGLGTGAVLMTRRRRQT